ncbi:HAD family hydrolase [Pseudactinotalea suaedae]|uniref:HAD family hydrolase n=1 Tax=Pseudactinotalea suaedae TaxID=1524924 RepID=UPI0012E14D7A|nr:HAD family hydrolase [Pseudactinotalea suaedae]
MSRARPPRLVATDLDGTLVRSDGTVSGYTRAVLAALDERDVPVLFVTARPLRWMEELWPIVGGHGTAIVSNGAIWFDVPSRSVRHLWGIDAEVGVALTDAIAAAVPEATFALETESGIRYDPRFVDEWDPRPGSPRGPLRSIWTDPVVKLLVTAPRVDPERLRTATLDAVGDRAVVTWTGPHLLEISAAGITKAATLARVAAELGVTAADVVAFGDMPNDIPMITWAGTGYAMANADATLLEVADATAPGNDDDGVARVLADLFGLDVARSGEEPLQAIDRGHR